MEALKLYKTLLQRFYDDDAQDNDDTFGSTALSSRNHAKAVLLYKMSRFAGRVCQTPNGPSGSPGHDGVGRNHAR